MWWHKFMDLMKLIHHTISLCAEGPFSLCFVLNTWIFRDAGSKLPWKGWNMTSVWREFRWAKRWRLSEGMRRDGCWGGLDLQEEEDHISPQVTITSSSSSSSSSLSAFLRSYRLSSERFCLDQDANSRTGIGPGVQLNQRGTSRIRVPAAGPRHAGHGEDGRTRSSGLERILQRGGRSLCARFIQGVGLARSRSATDLSKWPEISFPAKPDQVQTKVASAYVDVLWKKELS